MTHYRRFAASLMAALFAGAAGTAAAQQTVNGYPVGPDGEPLANPPRQFVMGAGRDEGVSDLRSAGYFQRVCVENYTGWADYDRSGGCGPFFELMNNGFTAGWVREGHWSWATTKSTWEAAVALVPELANAIGGGWTVSNSHQTGFDDLGPADNSLGQHHSGARTVNDRSCLDMRTSFAQGRPVLAGSNCPVTWGTEPTSLVRDPADPSRGWAGARPVPLEVYEDRFLAQGHNFNFDFWRVTDAELDAAGVAAFKTIGNFQTYGYTSDYGVEILCGTSIARNFAHIIPATSKVVPGGCSGSDPARRRHGWPLGIEVRFDAFTFQLPALKEVQYYQVTFTNRSEDLYGVKLDYDSVYLSLQQGWFMNGNLQQNPTFWVPAQGALYTISLPSSHPCTPAQEVSDITCARYSGNFGFEQGASALIVLKSPIGDQRNKWFSRVGSPFYDPTHPLAGDTLTYQHGHLCGFRACGRNTFATDPAATPDHERRGFGQYSSTETNTIGDRLLSDITDQVYWHTFRNFNFPTVRYTQGDAPSVGGGYNKWAPAMVGTNWDWGGPPGSMNPKDGVQDTLSVDGCWINGCAALWGDTLPNGKLPAYSNTHGTMGVGPIRLMADSVVSFVVAITTAQAFDSAGLMAQVAAAIDNYMNFYLAPEAAPRCEVTGITRTQGARAQDAVIRLTWDNACFPDNWTDPFLAKQALDLANAAPGSALERLRLLNPNLVDTLTFLSTNNLRTLYLFKSCSDGNAWTTGDDCIDGSPATGAPFDVLGWQPYATWDADAATGIPSTFADQNVRPGQTYTYNLIGQTRGANFTVLNGDSVDLVGTEYVCLKNCRVEPLNLAPVLFNTLSVSTGEPNVGRVYLPVSLQAGASASAATVTAATGPMQGSRLALTVTKDSLADATYRARVGNSAHATQIQRYLGTDSASVSTRLVLAVDAAQGDSIEILGTNLGGITAAGATVSGPVTIAPGVDSIEYAWTGQVIALTRETADALLVSSLLDGTRPTTPGTFHGSVDYPGFDLDLDATLHTRANGGFNVQQFYDVGGTEVGPLVAPTVTWLPLRAVQDQGTAQNQAYGDYTVTWSTYAFGTGGNGGRDQFILDFSNPGTSATAINASIAGRTAASTGAVTPEVAVAVEAATGLVTTVDSLVAVKLPFTIANGSYGRAVTVAMRARPGKTIIVGVGADTIRVLVPDDAWVPGDALYLLEPVAGGPLAVTFERAVIGCDQTRFTRESCNPVYPGTRGSTVYLSPVGQQYEVVSYFVPLTTADGFTVTATKPARGENLTSDADAIREGLSKVRVVPNPYIMLSQYAGNVMLFTHVPPRGYIRVYTVSGQFVQQITWDESNLVGEGDLSWNLRTREGNLLGAGLYLYVLTATDANGGTIGTRTDKFVVIR